MNERRIIEQINAAPGYRPANGSRVCESTDLQQRVANLIGRLLLHAKKRGRRRQGKWV